MVFNSVSGTRFITMFVVVLLALFMLFTFYFAGRSLALLRGLAPQASRKTIRKYMLPIAISGSILLLLVFLVGALIIFNKNRYTDPATNLLVGILFSLTVGVTAAAYTVYFSIKDVGSLSPADLRDKTNVAFAAARWAVWLSIVGITMSFVLLLLINAESQHDKAIVPHRILI